MTATVDQIIEDVLDQEGGFVDHPADRGEATKYGITKATLSQWRGHNVRRIDVERLSREEAHRIIKRRYIDVQGIHRLEDVALQAQVVDISVHSGAVNAVKDLQRAVRAKQDGIIGPKTLGRIRSKGVAASHQQLVVERVKRLGNICVKDPSQNVFLKGWLNRALSFLQPRS
jgi:lysozyme family protein